MLYLRGHLRHLCSSPVPYTTLFRSEARRVLAAEQIGEVDDARRFCRRHLRDDIVELGHVTAHHSDLLAEIAVVCGLRIDVRSEEYTSELQSLRHLVCGLLLDMINLL